MTVGGIALALIAVISVRQQRLYADVADRAALTGQLRQASAVLPDRAARARRPVAGDIREARDTAIELRSSIATAVVCDTLAGSIVLAPATAGADDFRGLSHARSLSGDTAWVSRAAIPSDAWIPYPVSQCFVGRAQDRAAHSARD